MKDLDKRIAALPHSMRAVLARIDELNRSAFRSDETYEQLPAVAEERIVEAASDASASIEEISS